MGHSSMASQDVGTLESDRSYHHESSNHLHLPHHICFSSTVVKITWLLVVLDITFYILNQSSYSSSFFQQRTVFSFLSSDGGNAPSPTCIGRANNSSLMQLHHQEITKKDKVLEDILNKAAMGDSKTVVLTTLNAAWTKPGSIFDLFLESFKIGNGTLDLLKHVVVGALDQTAYSRCTDVGLHCYALTTAGVNFSGEAHFMSDDYINMVMQKIDFLHNVLELGFHFVFTDADVMWFRDPFPRFYPDGDIQISCDHYWFNSTDVGNSPNSGFMYVRSNNRTIKFYKFWYEGKDYFPGKHDQDVLNIIRFTPFVNKLGLQIRFLDTAYFGGFCEAKEDMDVAVTMHANCCIGLETKIHDIKGVIDDWKRYMSVPTGVERNSSMKTWTLPRICR